MKKLPDFNRKLFLKSLADVDRALAGLPTASFGPAETVKGRVVKKGPKKAVTATKKAGKARKRR